MWPDPTKVVLCGEKIKERLCIAKSLTGLGAT